VGHDYRHTADRGITLLSGLGDPAVPNHAVYSPTKKPESRDHARTSGSLMRGPNQVTSKSDVVAFINTAARRLTDWPAGGRPSRPAAPAPGVRSGHVQMSSPANAVESGKACGRALPLQELVGQSFFISRRRAGPVASLTAGRRKATRTQIRRSHAPTRRSIIFSRLLCGDGDYKLDVSASWKPRRDATQRSETPNQRRTTRLYDVARRMIWLA